VELFYKRQIEVKQIKKVKDLLCIPPDAMAGGEISFDAKLAMYHAKVWDNKKGLYMSKVNRHVATTK
jgi:hypothetical protein